MLVENQGRLVTKATLLDRVWPRLVVDENNLPAQIASLRRVLGAGAISTVPRFGYRLDLAVSPGSADPTATAAATAAVPRLSVPRVSWPARLGPLIGRDDDLREIEAAVEKSSLVVVVGGAGVGKTRLAQEILARAVEKPERAVAWVSLESLASIEHVPSAIALALGLSLTDGQDGFASLVQSLDQQPLLLILDGVEHLADGLAAPLATLVARCRALRLLATSQVPLGFAGETIIRLPGLPVPDSGALPADGAATASCNCLPCALRRPTAASSCPGRTRRSWARSAGALTAIRSRSSSPPRAFRVLAWLP